MLLPSIRRLALADLTPEVVAELVEHGESLLVERKLAMPDKPRFGAAAASFANTLGGFILLGVRDDGEIEGWAQPDRTDLQSHLGAVLRGQVDPLPPFIADMREVDGKRIGVLRVFESADAPHIVRGTGAIYVRTSKGKEPVDDHRTLLALAARGEHAAAKARARLEESPAMRRELGLRRPGDVGPRSQAQLNVSVRATPLTVTPPLREWALASPTVNLVGAHTSALLPDDEYRSDPNVRPYGRAVAARAQWRDAYRTDECAIVCNDEGVIGARLALSLSRVDGKPQVATDSVVDKQLRPLTTAVVAILHSAEAYGRASLAAQLVMPSGGRFDRQEQNSIRPIDVTAELTVPAADDEVEAVIQAWHRAIQRTAGIPAFEP